MPLLSSPNASLCLDVLGYPDYGQEDPDGWLRIRLAVNRSGEMWDLVDDCLTTQELHRLAAWLRRIVEGDYSQPGSWTIDDQPAFEIADDHKSLLVTVAVWKLHLPDGADWIDLEFPLDSPELTRFAEEMAAEAKRFPMPTC